MNSRSPEHSYRIVPRCYEHLPECRGGKWNWTVVLTWGQFFLPSPRYLVIFGYIFGCHSGGTGGAAACRE